MNAGINRKLIGRLLGFLIILGVLGTGWNVYWKTVQSPRTDDAEVFANLIGIAPEVSGPITRIYVHDNQFVKKGDLLFEIDDQPYRYAWEAASSQQATLEGQIRELNKKIAAQQSAVHSANAAVGVSRAGIEDANANIGAAAANVQTARAGIIRAEADYTYTQENLKRLEALLKKQFVTIDQVEAARSNVQNKAESVRQAQSQLVFSQAQLKSARAQQHESGAQLLQSEAQAQGAIHNVSILDPLLAQRQQRAADVKSAAYNLSRCKIYAPFDARVTNLLISEGEYAHAGQKVFTLIDTRTWWAIANFRESQLNYITPGMQADVFVMSQPGVRYQGVVDSLGYGVEPDSNLIGTSATQALPDVRRTLNWVRLASRFPVRIRVLNPSPDQFRIGASALVIIRGEPAPATPHPH